MTAGFKPGFIHLLVHTEYSLVDSLVRVSDLAKQVAASGMPAVAVTDQGNLFALVKFFKAATSAGVKPIVGVDVLIRNEDDINQPFRMVLLAKDETGYLNLKQLVSRGYLQGQHLGSVMLERSWLDESSCQGLIALSGGRDGDVGRALICGNLQAATAYLGKWLALFGDRYYLQLSRTGRPGEEDCLHASVELAGRMAVPVVATNDVCFLKQDEFDAHEVRVCIHDGRTLDDSRRPKKYAPQQYLRAPEEMAELFADIPEALENSVEIAKRCNLELTLGKSFLPDFPVPEGMSIDQFFDAEAKKGLQERLQILLDPQSPDYPQKRAEYEERLRTELDVIKSMGFPGYFLIVAEFIQWAKDQGIPVGPGRGSGAGSLVAYALKITDLDPLAHGLLFERFLNPERVSMPDFDVDFCMDRRDEVIDHVAQKYGRDAVSQIITYGTMAAKAVVRDVGRVLGHPYGFTDRIAKMVPFEIGITLDKALEDSEELREFYHKDDEVRQLIDMAKQLEGLARNAGKHAGGVVIAPGRLTDFSALYCEPDGQNLVTQFDKNDVEAVGLVKFDFLGLRTLTIIDWALKTVNAERKAQNLEALDIARIPTDDPASFALLKKAQTTAVFQLESSGMKELIRKLQPDCFDDITALVALYRPGPLGSGMVDDFIARKHGHQQTVYPHPKLEPILEATYGVILYQEQVMQIAQVLAGYSLGGADLLRRAMGKKKPEEMEKQRGIFREGALARGVEEGVATQIFDLMAKFADYGFNKSHSAAYALVSYQTLWLKAHYPAAFMAATLSSDMDKTDKVVTFIEECHDMGLKVVPPDVNRSDYAFTVDGADTVVYGLGAVKGVGLAAIEGIVQSRKQQGRYLDLFDFCRRIDLRKANKRVLEALVRSGALDALGKNRATLMDQMPLALKMAEQHHAQLSAGQADLFGPADERAESGKPVVGLVPAAMEEWDDAERLRGEKETLGLFLTGHPIEFYLPDLKALLVSRISDLSLDESNRSGRKKQSKQVTVGGLLLAVNKKTSQRGMMANLLLDDRSGRIEATLFSEKFDQYKSLLKIDSVLVLEAELSFDDYRNRLSLRVENLATPESLRQSRLKTIRIELDESHLRENHLTALDWVDRLRSILKPHVGGTTSLDILYKRHDGQALIRLGQEWHLNASDELVGKLQRWLGIDRINLKYLPRPQLVEQSRTRA